MGSGEGNSPRLKDFSSVANQSLKASLKIKLFPSYYLQEESSRMLIGFQKYTANKVKFTMSGLQLNISQPIEKQENMTKKQ